MHEVWIPRIAVPMLLIICFGAIAEVWLTMPDGSFGAGVATAFLTLFFFLITVGCVSWWIYAERLKAEGR